MKIEPKVVNRAAIHNSQLGVAYRKYGEIGLMLPTPTQRLLQSGYTPFRGGGEGYIKRIRCSSDTCGKSRDA